MMLLPLLLLFGAEAKTETADAIMARVAENQNQAQEMRMAASLKFPSTRNSLYRNRGVRTRACRIETRLDARLGIRINYKQASRRVSTRHTEERAPRLSYFVSGSFSV